MKVMYLASLKMTVFFTKRLSTYSTVGQHHTRRLVSCTAANIFVSLFQQTDWIMDPESIKMNAHSLFLGNCFIQEQLKQQQQQQQTTTTCLLIDISVPRDRNVIRKKLKSSYNRNTVHVACNKNRDDNKWGTWNHLRIILTVPEQHTWKA